MKFKLYCMFCLNVQTVNSRYSTHIASVPKNYFPISENLDFTSWMDYRKYLWIKVKTMNLLEKMQYILKKRTYCWQLILSLTKIAERANGFLSRYYDLLSRKYTHTTHDLVLRIVRSISNERLANNCSKEILWNAIAAL